MKTYTRYCPKCAETNECGVRLDEEYCSACGTKTILEEIKWNIGKEAREIDKLPLREKMKIDKNTIKKMVASTIIFLVAFIILIIVM